MKSANAYYDMAIGKDFVEAWSRIKTGSTIDDAKRIHRLELYLKDLFRYDELIIDADHENTTLQSHR